MTSKELRYVKTIAEEKSLSRAAEKLGVTQSALSHCLSGIEADLGQTLFLRSSRGLVLTLAGEKYCKTATEILRLYSNLETTLGDSGGIPSGKLSFGMTRTLSACLLPNVIYEYKQKCPDVKLNLLEDSSYNILAELVAGRLDFVLVPHAPDYFKDNTNISCTPLWQDPCVVIVKRGSELPAHHLVQEDGISKLSINALAQMPIIRVSKQDIINHVVDGAFLGSGIVPDILLTSTDYETAKLLACTGLGATIVPQSTLGVYGQLDADYYLLSDTANAHWVISLVTLAESKISLAATEFMELIRTELTRHIEQSRGLLHRLGQ